MSLFTLLSERYTARDNYENECKHHGSDECHEPVVVVSANTVINPRAVVVKALYTLVTYSTVL